LQSVATREEVVRYLAGADFINEIMSAGKRATAADMRLRERDAGGGQ